MKFAFPFSDCLCPTSENSIINQTGHGSHLTLENFRLFSYTELKAATNGFHASNKIGEGGFGSVFKGQLKDGIPLAVKVLSVEAESMRGEREFISEISALSDVRHENLVTLRGCCVEGAKRFLIYDKMENNSLAHTFLGTEQNRRRFSWRLRREISVGVARGIAYLHEAINPHIVHRDIKASNVLLDHNFTPKVSDFGLSKLFGDNVSYISTRVAGTLGYLSPEYAISGRLSRKSDVYSFGVLLLEIVSGRPVVDFVLERGEQFLVDKAWEIHCAENLEKLVDPILSGDFTREEAVRFLKVGLLCVQETANLRPKMSTVVKMLTGEFEVDGVKITPPGLVADLMDLKIGPKNSSSQSFFSKASTSTSTD